jgi:hypothetical protein
MDADVSSPHFENPHIRSINEIIYSKDPENTKKQTNSHGRYWWIT